MRVHRAALLTDAVDLPVGAAVPGKVVALAPQGLVVACGEGALALQSLQRPGRKAVSAREFAAAVPIVGEVLS